MKQTLRLIFFLFLFVFQGKSSILIAQAPGATCATATTLAIGACAGSQTMTDFTSEVTSPAISCISGGVFRREGWYSFTVPAGPSQNITVTGTSITTNSDLAIQIISGTCPVEAQVTCANATTGGSAQTEQATMTTGVLGVATTYFVRIINLGSAVNMLMQNICINNTTANDNCAGAQPITPAASCSPATTTAGTLSGATSSNVPGSGCNPTANNDVWYSFVASGSTQTVTVAPTGTLTMDADFELFETACGGTNLVDILGGICEDNFGVGISETGTFSGLTPGLTYWVRVFDNNTSVATSSTFSISIVTLANDDCSSAIPLTVGLACTPTSGCDDNATDSGIPPAGCATAGTPDDDVWYRFVATTASHVVTVVGSTGFTPVFEVYSNCAGTTVAGGCMVGTAGSTISSVVTGLTPGATYYVRVYDFGSGYPSTTTFTICIGNQPPANNDCAGAVNITPSCTCVLGTSMFNGDVASATQTIAATCSGAGTANDDVWYKFTTTATPGQSYVITVSGSASFNAVFQVYSGSCGGTNVTCINATGTGGTETATLVAGVALAVNTTYWVRVYDATTTAYPATTTFSICITIPPLNDACPGTTITPGVTCVNTVGNLCGASSSGVAATCGGTPTDDVWYSFIAAGTTQIITVTPCGTMNPVIQVFSGSCGGTSISCTNLLGAGGAETVTLTGLGVGTTYWVRVYDFTGAPACTAFGICITTPPANDDCVGAINLTPATNCVNTTGTDAGATQSMVAGTCGGTPNDDVWYSFTASTSNQTITVVGCASFNPVVEAYSGTCGSLTSLGCVNTTGTGGTETLTLTGLTSGTVYYIRVYDFTAAYPACTTFSICVTSPIPNDCSNAYNICTNFSFPISPWGIGSVNDVPPAGTLGNPTYVFGDGALSPWGTDHAGCLLNGEISATWWIINVSGSGSLEFVMGGGGTMAGFNDWIMWPYTTCGAITSGNVAPVRCNWNQSTTGGTGCVSVIPPGGNAGNFETPIAVVAGSQYCVCFTNWSGVTTSLSLTFGGSASVTCLPLPIDLLSFTGEKQSDGTNLLKWTTGTETNNDYFLIKKSKDAVYWENLGIIPGAGNSYSPRSYQMEDESPETGINYYRLFQIDYNGMTVPFNVVSIENNYSLISVINVHPNPTNEDINFDFITNLRGKVHIQIIDYLGRIVAEEDKTASIGKSALNAKMSHLPNGIYSLIISFDQTGIVYVNKIVKN
jgi:hypothetical protein